MIVFDLACECGYTFEGWFQDRQHFEDQLEASYLECPLCGGHGIRKILSPVRFQTSLSRTDAAADQAGSDSLSAAKVRRALQTLQKFIETNFEDVGSELAAEALKIHYGVSEPRSIRGVATAIEEKSLDDEGIRFIKIPRLNKEEKPH